MKLVEIPPSGIVADSLEPCQWVDSVVEAMVELYRQTGFVRPWIGYLAIQDHRPLGTCGFKSPPVAGRVEIAYFTFPDHQGQGIGSVMAKELVRLAQQNDPNLTIVAQTLPEKNTSTSILRKLGFRLIGSVEHPHDGTVWEWQFDQRRASSGAVN